MVVRSSPDGLPPGWTVDCKVLNSGRKLKYYSELKTGKKFYSRNEVSRYIKSKNGKKIATRISRGKCSKGSVKKNMNVIKKTHLDSGWLPRGWLVELRQYEAGPKIGRNYKVYTDKSTGHKCYSRLEVLRWLKKKNHEVHMVRGTKKARTTRSKSYMDTKNSKARIKEHQDVVEFAPHTPICKKLRRSAQNVSSRALVTNTSPSKSQKLAAEGNRLKNATAKGTYALRSFTMSDGPVNGVQTRGYKSRQQSELDKGSTLTSTTDVINDDNISKGNFRMRTTGKNRGSLPSRFSKRLAKLEPDVVTASPAKRSSRDQKALCWPTSEKMNAGGKGCQSLSVTEIYPILKEENTVSTGKNSYDSSNNTKKKRDSKLCRRFSKRLAGFEPEVAPLPDSIEKVVQGVGKRLCTYHQVKSISGSALPGVVHKSCQQSSYIEEPDLSRCLLNKSNSDNGLDLSQSPGFGDNAQSTKREMRSKKERDKAKRLAVVELEEAVSNSSGEVESRLPTTSHNLQPTSVEACKETQQETPVWHSWSDPCLEFAFKTLTGEISIEDDLQIQSYFQQIKKPAEKDARMQPPHLKNPFSPEQTQADLSSWFQHANGGDPGKIK